MKTTICNRNVRWFFLTLVLTAGLMAFSGCVTTQEEGDIPWNERQSWEGSPYFPGLQTQ